MIEDDELIARLRAILTDADLSSITINMIIAQLEEYYKCDLKDRKTMLRDALNAYIQEKIENDNIFDDNDDDDNDDGGDNINASDYDNDDDDDDIVESKLEINNEDEEPKGKKRGGSGGGFQKPVQLSTALSEFFGGDAIMPRTEVTKRMWAYIRENNLQNPDDKREILCDAALEKLFKRKKFTMFKMTKYLAPMQKSIDSLQDAPSTKSKPKTSPKPKAVKSEGSSNSKAGKNSLKETKTKKTKETKSSSTKEKKSGGGGGGFAAVCDLSPALSKFLGVDELPRTQIVSKMWEYIKGNDLQNPANKKEILMDKKMKELFVGVDKLDMFSMNKHLSKHIYKKE